LRRLSAALAEAIDRADAEPDKNGWLRVAIPIESVEHAAQEMLKLGVDVEVVEPEALRHRLARTAREVAAIYASSSSPRRRTSRARDSNSC
jgi:predicted DNA-binding transcriptional regulator YafY